MHLGRADEESTKKQQCEVLKKMTLTHVFLFFLQRIQLPRSTTRLHLRMVLVEDLAVEALAVEALAVEAQVVEALVVEALVVEAPLVVEALVVEALLVRAEVPLEALARGMDLGVEVAEAAADLGAVQATVVVVVAVAAVLLQTVLSTHPMRMVRRLAPWMVRADSLAW
jgi:hypothetical protein